ILLARAHADALHGLEKFPFGFDRWGDDDLRLLKLGNVARANVAHASRDRADQILTSIVNFGRTKKDLLQRTGGTDLDPRTARKIHVRRSHAPVVTGAGRFLSTSERAADHDGICATSERFANVAAFAHPAVGDDRNVTRRFFEISVAGGCAIDRGSDLRHAESKHTARGASCAGSDTNKHASWAAFHDFESDVITNSVSDDHWNAHVGAKFCEIERFVLGGKVARGRDRALDDINLCARFLRDRTKLSRPLRNRTDAGDPALIFNLSHTRCDQIGMDWLLINPL